MGDMIDKYGDTPEEIAQHIGELNEAQKIRLMSALAKSRGIDYTIDETKRGEGIYYDDRQSPICPPNGGRI